MTVERATNIRTTKVAPSGRSLLAAFTDFGGPSDPAPTGGTLAADLDLIREPGNTDTIGGEFGGGIFDFTAQLGLFPDVDALLNVAIVVIPNIDPGVVPTQADVVAATTQVEAATLVSVAGGQYFPLEFSTALLLPNPEPGKVNYVGLAWVEENGAVTLVIDAGAPGQRGELFGLEV